MARTPQADRLERKLKAALADAQKTTVVSVQSWLGDSANVPRDTGRFRSSWFASVDTESSAVPSEGADAPQTDAQGLRFDWSESVYLTSNLPYSTAVTLGINLPPSWQGQNRVNSADRDWFWIFLQGGELGRIQQQAVRAAKRRWGF